MSTEYVIADLVHLRESVETCDHRRIIDEAIAEIERLRALQFRWIPVSERMPMRSDGDNNQCVFVTCGGRRSATLMVEYAPNSEITHWAPIPPLPEKSMEENDRELFKEWCRAQPEKACHSVYDAYMAGLKAARESK